MQLNDTIHIVPTAQRCLPADWIVIQTFPRRIVIVLEICENDFRRREARGMSRQMIMAEN